MQNLMNGNYEIKKNVKTLLQVCPGLYHSILLQTIYKFFSAHRFIYGKTGAAQKTNNRFNGYQISPLSVPLGRRDNLTPSPLLKVEGFQFTPELDIVILNLPVR